MAQVYLLLANTSKSLPSTPNSQCVLPIQANLQKGIRSDELSRPEALESKVIIDGIAKRHHPAELTQSVNKGTYAAFGLLSREGYNKNTMVVIYSLHKIVINQHGFSGDLAFSLAFITSFFKQQHYPDIAATGIVSDEGEILAVEYIDEKLTAAIVELPNNSWVFLPKVNESDLSEDLASECATRSIQLHFVDHLDEVCALLKIQVRHYYQYNPFRGLDCFELKHAALFFGRNKEIKQACQQLRSRWEINSPSLLISGASGSGKSSIAQAGLLHEAIYGNLSTDTLPPNNRIIYSIFRPRQLIWDVESASKQRLWDTLAKHWSHALSVPLIESISDISTASSALHEAIKAYAAQHSLAGVRYIWFIDQLEELFTLDWKEAERINFIRLLITLADEGIWIITTLRADIFPHGEEGRLLHKHFQSQGRYDLPPQDNTALRSIICEPAKLAGLQLEEKEGLRLEQRILQDINYQTDALPLLQLALSQLYQQRDQSDNQLTFAAYERIGGIEGAISNWAQKTLEDLPTEQFQIFPTLLRHLVAVQKNYQGISNITARSVSFNSLPETIYPLVESLVNSRLLIREKENVRVAHEAIFSHWGHAKSQLDSEEADLVFLQDLRQSSNDFHYANEQRSPLFLSRNKLREALKLQKKWSGSLSYEINIYIKKSKQKLMKRKVVASFFFIAFFVVVLLYFFGWQFKSTLYYRNVDRAGVSPVAHEAARLTFQQHENNDMHYKVIRKGRLGRIEEINLVNRYDECPLESASLLTTWSGDYSQNNCWCDIKICKITFEGKIEKGFNSLGGKIYELSYLEDDDPMWDEKAIYTDDKSLHPRTEADIVKFKHGSRGKEVKKISYWTKNKNRENIAVTDHLGVHEYHYDFTESGRVISEEYSNPKFNKFDNDELCKSNIEGTEKKRKDGTSKIVKRTNRFGEEIEVSYYSMLNKPMNNKNKYHKIFNEYDDNGNLKIQRVYDTSGNLKNTTKFTNEKLLNGYLIKELYLKPGDNELEEKENKCPRDDGRGNCYSSIERAFDINGRLIEESYYNSEAGKKIPVLVTENRRKDEMYHKKILKHSFNITSIKYFNEFGEPIDIGGRYHEEKDIYNKNGALIETSYFTLDGEKSEHKAGHHTMRFTHNENTGYFTSYQLLDKNGHPVKREDTNSNLYSGYSKIDYRRDNRGNTEETKAYDSMGNVFYYSKRTFDNRDNLTSVSYFDKNMMAIANPSILENPSLKIWKTCSQYDINGNEVEKRHYDVNKNLVMNAAKNSNGFAVQNKRYDTLTREKLCTTRRDEKNKLIDYSGKNCLAKEKNI